MIEFMPRLSATMPHADRISGDEAPAGARVGRTVSLLLDLGRGSHALVREIVAIQALADAGGWQRGFQRTDEPLASVILRGGLALPAFRPARELRDEWESSLVVFDPAELAAR